MIGENVSFLNSLRFYVEGQVFTNSINVKKYKHFLVNSET